MKCKYRNREFWCRGYCVDTAGKDAKKIKEYIKHQLDEGRAGELTCTEKLSQILCEFFIPMFFGKFTRSFVLQAAMWPKMVVLPTPHLDFLPGFRHRAEPVFI